jgi:hypothetical protein
MAEKLTSEIVRGLAVCSGWEGARSVAADEVAELERERDEARAKLAEAEKDSARLGKLADVMMFTAEDATMPAHWDIRFLDPTNRREPWPTFDLDRLRAAIDCAFAHPSEATSSEGE